MDKDWIETQRGTVSDKTRRFLINLDGSEICCFNLVKIEYNVGFTFNSISDKQENIEKYFQKMIPQNHQSGQLSVKSVTRIF